MKTVKRVIALEECFWTPELKAAYDPKLVAQRDQVSQGRLSDVGPERIARMDAAGIDLQVLSLVSPGPQCFDAPTGIRLAKNANDWLGGIVQKYPTRFAGFAALPTQDPQVAADELERTVKDLGFKGALINGQTKGRYLDDKDFWVIFERAEALDVPIYIHPAELPPPIMDTYFKGPAAALAGAGWGWAIDTGTHLLRIISSGAFDAFPNLKIVIGHMGELIPFHMKRIQRGFTMAAKMGGGPQLKKTFSEYMRDNVYITTSGVFEHASLLCSVSALGIDNILFSVDDPFADNMEAMAFLNNAPLSLTDKEKLAHGNAEKLLKL